MTLQPQPTPQPVISSRESWHLARAQALGMVLQLLRRQTPGGPRTLDGMIQAIGSHEAAAWQAYFTDVGVPEEVQSQLKAIEATFDTELQMPVVSWPETGHAMSDRWEFLDLPAAGEDQLVMTAPFRPVLIGRLPEGSRALKITDPRHSANAALMEALECAGRDVDAAFLAKDEVIAWRRLGQVVSVYREAAKLVYSKSLRDDDFNAWMPMLPREISFDRASSLICQVGATARAHEMLAFHVLAQWMQACADRIETTVQAGQRKEAFATEMSAALQFQRKHVQPLHHELAARSGLDPEAFHFQAAFRPFPGRGPQLLALPRSNCTIQRLRPGAQDRA